MDAYLEAVIGAGLLSIESFSIGVPGHQQWPSLM
jgi:hypothetical protein